MLTSSASRRTSSCDAIFSSMLALKALGMILDKDLQVRSEVVKSTYLSFCLGHIWDGQKEIFGKEGSDYPPSLERHPANCNRRFTVFVETWRIISQK